jgi:hypothetical protein
VDAFDVVGARVVECERDDGGGTVERRCERVCLEIRDDVIHRVGTFRQVAKFGELTLELSVGRFHAPILPSAPALETAAASAGDVKIVIPAWMIGTSIPTRSHSGERTLPPSSHDGSSAG